MDPVVENFWNEKQDRPIIAIYIIVTVILGAVIILFLLEYGHVITAPGWVPFDFSAYYRLNSETCGVAPATSGGAPIHGV